MVRFWHLHPGSLLDLKVVVFKFGEQSLKVHIGAYSAKDDALHLAPVV